MTEKTKDEVRYTLRIPTGVHEELEALADELNLSRTELIRKFIKLGMMAVKLDQEENSGIYIEKNGEMHKLWLL